MKSRASKPKYSNQKLLKIIFKNIKYIFLISSIFIVIFLKYYLHLNLFISIIIALSLIFLIRLLIHFKFLQIMKKSGMTEDWNELYGKKILNIPYFKNEQIINSYKKGGDNYIEEIGEVNNSKDYQKNERNYYDIYIPYSSLKRKNKYNGIILFIHGGGWHNGKKESKEFLCARYCKQGYITATMNYTLLKNKYKEYSIFRILDEITACIESIKNELKNEGFDENKLELAIGGSSAGAHLSLLYSYSIKKSLIPIKFVINLMGPISLEPEFFYKIKDEEDSLEAIEQKDIENAIKEKKLEKCFEDELFLIKIMNEFLGHKFNDNEIKEMVENSKIRIDNEKYKQMSKMVKYLFPYNFINSNTVPTLCVYGGRDEAVGITQYSYLKKLSEKYGNKIELVYMKNSGHILLDYYTEDGINSLREMNYQILNFAKTYFTNDN